MSSLLKIVKNYEQIKRDVDAAWLQLGVDFIKADCELQTKFMARRELSFHDHVKLLGYLVGELYNQEGDIVEIGVWKGKSLALMERLSDKNCQIIGIDPCEIQGQQDELNYFKSKIYSRCHVIVNYSHTAMPILLGMTRKIKLFHIDGGHMAINVWLDFMLYNPFVISGGFIVFDDYNDYQHSPEVKVAVDEMQAMGLFSNFDVIGVVDEFKNSFLLKKH